MSSRSGMLDNLLPVFKPCLNVCVCIRMCEHSLHGQASELSAQRGGQQSACRPTQWTLEGRFILHHYLVLKDHSESEGAGCLQSFVHTENTHLSSSQSLIYPLNPYLSVASRHILLSHVIDLFSVRMVKSQSKYVSYLLYQDFVTFLTQIWSLQWYNSVSKSTEEFEWITETFWCI